MTDPNPGGRPRLSSLGCAKPYTVHLRPEDEAALERIGAYFDAPTKAHAIRAAIQMAVEGLDALEKPAP